MGSLKHLKKLWCTGILTVSALISLSEVQYEHN